jgi:hypothetical protein
MGVARIENGFPLARVEHVDIVKATNATSSAKASESGATLSPSRTADRGRRRSASPASRAARTSGASRASEAWRWCGPRRRDSAVHDAHGEGEAAAAGAP